MTFSLGGRTFFLLLHSSSGLAQTSITFVNCLTFIFWRICNLFYHPVDELTIFQAFVNFSNFFFHIANMLPSLISSTTLLRQKLTLHNTYTVWSRIDTYHFHACFNREMTFYMNLVEQVSQYFFEPIYFNLQFCKCYL